MNKLDYANKIEELLDNALNELNSEEFDGLLHSIADIINDYY